MNRRGFLKSSLAPVVFARSAWAQPDGWRTFEIVTRVEIQEPAGITRAWLPLPLAGRETYQRVLTQRWRGNAPVLRAMRDQPAPLLFAEWPETESAPEVELTLRVATRDRATNWGDRNRRPTASPDLQRYLRPTRLMPLDGIARETARRITREETDVTSKARAIYEWIVENTVGNPSVRGCGDGNIRGMLTGRSVRGECADLNVLFVGLARAAGIPARAVCGLRIAPSRAFTSLGRAGDVTAAQHRRAEFHSPRHGWVPVDPADVRTVMRQERPGLAMSDPVVEYARRQLFGAWEMNWIALNDAQDVRLPKSAGPSVPFLIYPEAETAGRRLDSLAADRFRYTITAREIT
jgi:transglutaminase-like putative cysteine protease